MLKSAALVAALALASARSTEAHSVFACLVPNYPTAGKVSACEYTIEGAWRAPHYSIRILCEWLC